MISSKNCQNLKQSITFKEYRKCSSKIQNYLKYLCNRCRILQRFGHHSTTQVVAWRRQRPLHSNFASPRCESGSPLHVPDPPYRNLLTFRKRQRARRILETRSNALSSFAYRAVLLLCSGKDTGTRCGTAKV